MFRKATDQVTTIAVGISRNTGHLIGLANVIGMSPAAQGQTLTMLGTTSALPLQADKLGGKRTARFTMSDYGVTADVIRDLPELPLIANSRPKGPCPRCVRSWPRSAPRSSATVAISRSNLPRSQSREACSPTSCA